MAKKIHVTAVEENIRESGIQVRIDEPVTPIENQIWLNPSTGAIKTRKNGETIVVFKGRSTSIEVTGNTVNASLANQFYDSINSNKVYIIENLFDGEAIHLSVENVAAVNLEIEFDINTVVSNGEDLEVLQGTTKIFTIRKLNNILLVSTQSFSL